MMWISSLEACSLASTPLHIYNTFFVLMKDLTHPNTILLFWVLHLIQYVPRFSAWPFHTVTLAGGDLRKVFTASFLFFIRASKAGDRSTDDGGRNLRTKIAQGVTARPGARYGPGGIRQGSRRMFSAAGWSMYTGMGHWTFESLGCR